MIHFAIYKERKVSTTESSICEIYHLEMKFYKLLTKCIIIIIIWELIGPNHMNPG